MAPMKNYSNDDKKKKKLLLNKIVIKFVITSKFPKSAVKLEGVTNPSSINVTKGLQFSKQSEHLIRGVTTTNDTMN